MQVIKAKSNYYLTVKSVTWYKDSHSLFDYQSNKISAVVFNYPLTTKNVTLYRKRQSYVVEASDSLQETKYSQDQYQLLTRFDVKMMPQNKIRLNFFNDSQSNIKKINSQRLNTDQSISSYTHKEEQTYIIVRKLKELNGQPKGYKLQPGQTIKLGRVEYYVSQVSINGNIITADNKHKGKIYANRTVMKHTSKTVNQHDQKKQCKICLEQTEDFNNFLFNPCKCSGSCGSVHLQCLLQWIHIKVKKEVVGGTLHYNFEKFQCQVCKTDLPMVIQVNGQNKELLPIEKPKGNYLILQGACQKSKSVMMINNLPAQGIKLGRGHDCQIRITDISVSRNHAIIKDTGNGFHIYDNKSKFGTLVKEEKMNLELGKSQGIQIGRTVVTFDIKKQKQITKAEQ